MGFFSRIMAAFTGKAPGGNDRYLPIYVLDHRCREPISGQIDLLNELSLAEEEGGGYYVRKVLHTSGASRCFGQVEVQLWLDSKKQIKQHEVHGGRWLTVEEYDAEVERRAQAAAQAESAAASTTDEESSQINRA
ncbi:MAG TPA: hypothetical protein DCL15_20190 [Chloroflexi bacterium]|nr:hypothetical protein [Chloroflexota bacterium]